MPGDACAKTRKRMHAVWVTRVEEKLRLVLAASRGARVRCPARVVRAVSCCSEHARFLGVGARACRSLPLLCGRIQTLQNARIQDLEREVAQGSDASAKARLRA
eukprot:3021516-Pyramimonas_sp.AAC.1